MTEIILSITIFLIISFLLFYFYKREGRQVSSQAGIFENQLTRIENLVNSRDNLLKDIVERQSKLVTDTLTQSLKHIQVLEKQIIPKPLDRIADFVAAPISSPPIENDIEKTVEELNADSFDDAFRNIPITEETKVKIEGDTSQLPEEIM